MKASIITALLVSAVITATMVTAQVPTVPRYINFQGKLTDTNGLPLNGTYEITFNIYSNSPVPAPANWVWGETHASVEVQRGLFSVLLGSFTNLDMSCFPFDAAGNTNRWLEVRVGSDLLSPTKEFVSVPYAFRASDADMVDGLHADEIVGRTYTGAAPIVIDTTARTISLNYSGDDFQLTNDTLTVIDKWVDEAGDTMTGDLTMAAGTEINGINIINSQAITDGTIINDDINANANIAGSKVAAATATVRGTVELATDGESAASLAVQANDNRLSNSRAPTGSAGGDLSGTYPDPAIRTNVVTSAKIADSTIVDADIAPNANIAASKINEADPQVGANTPNYVPRWGWDGSVWALVTGSIYDPGTGNIGIGISPDYKLDVNGYALIRDSLFLSGGDRQIRALGLNDPRLAFLSPQSDGWTTVLVPSEKGFIVANHLNQYPLLYVRDFDQLPVLSLWGYATWSDDRIKFNKQQLEYGLAQIMALEPKRYDRAEWEIDPTTEELIIHPEKTKNEIGLVAQDVQRVIPEAVGIPEDENGALWSLSYDTIIPVLVKAIQEQQAQIETLKQENQALVARVATLESGSLTDTPLTADFDGDGKADRAMVDANGNWYFWLSNSGFVKIGPYNFGVIGKPAVSDFDGDGKADPAIMDASGNWYVWLSARGYSQSRL